MAQARSSRGVLRKLARGILVSTIAAAAPADAQEGARVVMEEVVVTGSALPETAATREALPVRTITREEIARTGATTLPEVLRRLPQNLAGFTETFNPGIGLAPGAAAVALRGLSVNSTLVLLNGRRLPVFPFAQNGTDSFVDLNTIPVAAIERVEVLTDGASALYGSDAVAGVVNIITRQNFTGAEVETQYGNTSRKDLSEVHSTLVSGFGRERFKLTLALDYLHRNSLASVDRRFSRSADQRRQGGADFRSPFSNPGTVQRLDNGNVFAVPRLRAVNAGLDENGQAVNTFDTSRFEDLIPETERRGGFLSAEGRPFDHLTVFIEGLYAHNRTKERAAPDSTGDVFGPPFFSGLSVPATNPFNPFGTEVAFGYRATDAGPRRTVTQTEAARVIAGVRLTDLPKAWEVEIAALAGEVRSVSRTDGNLSLERTIRALHDPDPDTALNVFSTGNGENDLRTIEGLKVRSRREGRSELRTLDARGRGELFDLPAGPLRLALGADYREEELSDSSDRRSRDGDILSGTRTAVDGARHAKSAFYEFAVPIVKPEWKVPAIHSFDLQAAGRYEEFSDFGDTFKPKFAAAWRPLGALLFRGSYAESFRAPSLAQLFAGSVVGFGQVIDPGTDVAAFPQVVTGGNPDLQPETAYARKLGFQVEPPFVPGLTFGADFFRIDQRNLIQSLSPQLLVNSEALFPGAVERDANGGLARVSTPFVNISSVIVDGVDLSLRYALETAWGTFRLGADAQVIEDYRLKTGPGRPEEDLADSFALPEFKAVLTFGWEKAGWATGATVNYIDSYGGVNEGEHVGAWTTLDLQLAYEFPRLGPTAGGKSGDAPAVPTPWGWRGALSGVRVSAGVENVFDEDPPFANTVQGYDPQTHDPRGRFFYFALRKTF